MKIKLIRYGGFIPLIKVAEKDTDFTEEEINSLLASIKADQKRPRIKDGNSWELSIDGNSTFIDPEKIPDEYKDLFRELKNNLRISRI